MKQELWSVRVADWHDRAAARLDARFDKFLGWLSEPTRFVGFILAVVFGAAGLIMASLVIFH